MGIILFLLGTLTGYYVEIRHDEYRTARMARLESLLMDEDHEDYEFHNAANGEIWAMKPGVCVRVF